MLYSRPQAGLTRVGLTCLLASATCLWAALVPMDAVFADDGFVVSGTLPTYGEPYGVKICDLDSDGRNDLVFSNGYYHIGVYIQSSDGSFSTRQDYSHGSLPFDPVVDDFDGDRILDVAFTCSPGGRGEVRIRHGVGDGTLGPESAIRWSANEARQITYNDLNRDGLRDFATAFWGSGGIGIAYADGLGGYTTEFHALIQDPWGITSGDFIGDSGVDVAAVSRSLGKVAVLESLPSGGFSAPVEYATTARPLNMASADLNGDGRLDLAITSQDDAGVVDVLLGRLEGGLAEVVSYSVGGPITDVIAEDLNADGVLDLAMARMGGIAILHGDGTGVFGNLDTYMMGGDYRTHHLDAGDLTGDGYPDLVLTCYGDRKIYLLTNTVPEPSTVVLLVCAGFALLAIYRR